MDGLLWGAGDGIGFPGAAVGAVASAVGMVLGAAGAAVEGAGAGAAVTSGVAEVGAVAVGPRWVPIGARLA